jgi:UDP-N-acetylglucosamine diphosphorylase/glucosamine-1-phosphate N-acetyltransferase
MPRPVVVFEDHKTVQLYPLSLTRPVHELVCGILSLDAKMRAGLKAASERNPGQAWWGWVGGEPDIRYHVRDYLSPGLAGAVTSYGSLCDEHGMVTLANGRLVLREGLLAGMEPDWQGKYVCGDDIVFATVGVEHAARLEDSIGSLLDVGALADLPARELDAHLIEYPWELITLNGEEIKADFLTLGGAGMESEPGPMVYITGGDNVRVGKGVRLGVGVAIDASTGPVSIGDDVVVMANASLQGPIHIGRGSKIKMGARICGETTIGPVCKIGGEVAETIIHGYSNKQHEGFVGHSYLGEWVNLGAGTDTSDMKNNYSTVKVHISGEPVDSGELFVGLFMGDHSKSGIGTVFNTGTVVGVCCNIFGADYPPKYIPSFAWGGAAGFAEHVPDKAIETAGRAMKRRGRTLDTQGESVLRRVFDLTADERKAFIGR